MAIIKKLLVVLLGFAMVSFSLREIEITVDGISYRFPWLPQIGGYGCVYDISARNGDKAQVNLQTEVEGRKVRVVCVFKSSDSLLRKLVVPKGYILVSKFWNFHNLDTVVLPSTLEVVRPDAFKGCEGLKEFRFSEKNEFLEFRDGCLLQAKHSALLYSMNGSAIPAKTRMICKGAFANRRDTSVVFIPNSVVKIEPEAFGTNSSITKVEFSSDNKHFIFDGGNIITRRGARLVCLLGPNCNISCKVKILGEDLFFFREDIDSICVPEGVTRIEQNCFNRSSLSYISLPSSLKDIGYGAFDCTNITSLSIPEGVGKLDNYIGCCTKLVSLSIPKSMKVVSHSVFGGCHHIKVVYMHSRDTKIEDGAFPQEAEIKYVDE